MDILIDTNVLLRRLQSNHPSHAVAMQSVAMLIERDDNLCLNSQIAAEFWNVLTRPVQSNGLGASTEIARLQLSRLERIFSILDDLPDIFKTWKRLVVEHDVRGVKVHDARLVASMKVHGVSTILTFNVADFRRFDIDILSPYALCATS